MTIKLVETLIWNTKSKFLARFVTKYLFLTIHLHFVYLVGFDVAFNGVSGGDVNQVLEGCGFVEIPEQPQDVQLPLQLLFVRCS